MNRRDWMAHQLGTLAVACTSQAAEATENANQFEQCVRDLVSPNQAPKFKDIFGENRPIDVEGWDVEGQQRVFRAFDKLLSAGRSAFGTVVEHVDDRRYSVTLGGYRSAYWYNYSVGTLCYRWLIEDNVVLYDAPLPSQEIPGCNSFLDELEFPRDDDTPKSTRKRLLKWWEPRQEWTLAQMQIEAIEWAIREDVRRQPKRHRAALRDQLGELLDKVQSSREPIYRERRLMRMIDPKRNQSASR